MGKKAGFIVMLSILIIFSCGSPASAESSLTINGLVKQHLELTAQDLEKFPSTQVQLNEVLRSGDFRGVFRYEGVPLKYLLELAGIKKDASSDFKKPIDMAIRVRNRSGEKVALSWGEVFYSNPASILIGQRATPIRPHKGRDLIPRSNWPWLEQLDRKVGFPKLVISDDFHTDRCLEEITSIDVIDLRPQVAGKKGAKLFSPHFIITGAVKREITFKSLAKYPLMDIPVKVVGEGRGYHGTSLFGGVSLKKILESLEPKSDLNTVFIISAPDAYRSLISYGEIFLSPSGRRIMMADQVDRKPISEDGKFILVLPQDLMADREVKAVEKIEVMTIK